MAVLQCLGVSVVATEASGLPVTEWQSLLQCAVLEAACT